jgi:hypothetical protein
MPQARPKNPKIVTRADHELIQQHIHLTGTEDYAVVIQKGKGFWNKSIHVFGRQPATRELQTFEESSSRLKFKGQKAEMEGSPIFAASELYNRLIVRAYDVLVGLKKYEQMNTQQCKDLITPLVKREAIREFTAEVYSASRMEEAEGISEGDDADDDEAKDDNPEAHTSGE